MANNKKFQDYQYKYKFFFNYPVKIKKMECLHLYLYPTNNTIFEISIEKVFKPNLLVMS